MTEKVYLRGSPKNMKLSDLLDVIKLNFPFVNMQKIAGVNPKEIQEPKDSSYTKHFLRAASLLAGGLGAIYSWKNQQKSLAVVSAAAGILLAAVLPDSD